MDIGFDNIDNLINGLSQRRIAALKVDKFSLGAACELAAWGIINARVDSTLQRLLADHWCLREAWRMLDGGLPILPKKPSSPVPQAFFPIRNAKVLCDLEWEHFLQRFEAALKRSGFVNGMNHALAKALHEMTDNIVQHSTLGSTVAMNGFAAYECGPRSFAFAVADVGVGVVSSLRDNRKYAHIQNGREAIELIARDHASRRNDRSEGGGYNDLFVGLARLNGQLRLRSADGLLAMEGALDRLNPFAQILHPVPGLQISVDCKI